MLLLQTTFGGFALNRQFWRYFDCLYGPMADEILTTTTSTTSTTVTTSTTDTGIEASTSEPTAVSSTEPLQAVQEVAGDDVMGENKAVGSWPSRVTQFAADWPSRKIESTADVEAEGEATTTTTPVVHASPTAPPAAPPAAAASPADEPIPGVLALALAHVFSSGELASYLEKGVVVAASGLLEDEVDDDDRSDASEASLDRLYSELFPNDDSEAGQKVAAPLASIKIDHKHSDKGFGGAINRITCSLKFDPQKLLSGLSPASTATAAAVPTTALAMGPVGGSDDEVDENKVQALLLVVKDAGRVGATLTHILTALSTPPPETNEDPSSGSASSGGFALVDKEEVLGLLTVCQARRQILRLEGPNRLQMYAVSRSQPIATDTQLSLERYVHHEYASLYSVSFLDTPAPSPNPTPFALTYEPDEGGCPWVTPSGQLNTQLYNTLRAKVISLLIDKPGSPFLQIHIALHILTCAQTRLFLTRLESKERLLYSERAAETLKTTPASTTTTSRSIWDSPSDKHEEQQDVSEGVGEGELWHIVHSTHYYLLSI